MASELVYWCGERLPVATADRREIQRIYAAHEASAHPDGGGGDVEEFPAGESAGFGGSVTWGAEGEIARQEFDQPPEADD